MTSAVPSSSTVLPTKYGEILESDMVNAAFFITFGIIVNLFNLLVILTVLNFRSVSNPDVLILALAIADYLSSWVLFPLGAYFYLAPVPSFNIICAIYTSTSTAIQLFSTAIITLITMDRFLAIRKPIFYRAKLSVPNLKRALVVLAIICILLSCLPLILQAFNVLKLPENTKTQCFSYHYIFAYILLIWSFLQIPAVIYFYIGFIFYIRQFINHKSQKSFDNIPSTERRKRRWYRIISCRWKSCRGKKTTDPPTRQEILEKTISMMKHLNLKRCTRMANTAAWIVVIFYFAWTLALVTITYQLITKEEVPVLNFIVIRLTLIDSILNPVVYASLCSHYKLGFQWAMFYPLRLCGYRKHTRKSALGLTVSEMKRVTQRMAIDEWESPGLNRRLYNRRAHRHLKNGSISARTDEIGFDNPGFEETSSSPIKVNTASCLEQTTVTTNAIVESSPQTSRQIQQDISPLNYHKRSRRPQEGAVVAQALEQQISDSGVDVESLHQEGVTSTCSSPAGIRAVQKDRGSINSTQSDPVMMTSPNHVISDKHTSASHMHSLRIETTRNTSWQSADTLIKIHVDVLELLNESAMLGPYCLQSKIKRCKLRSSERPPALKFSPRENRFVDRRTSFDDLDAYYLDFTKPIMEQFPKNVSNNTQSGLDVPSNSSGLDDVWKGQPFQDDLVKYSQLVMHKHKHDDESMRQNEHDRISMTTVSSTNKTDESTSF
ncbi:uncharacterized protein [Amphiura filiformis]|uniref:uncharacterized protein n=1 Tax=Amphiura filiformis TaxID=82378 RepID=UPI003B222251